MVKWIIDSKVRFGLWWRRLLDFLSRSDGRSCPNKKNRGRRNAISIHIPIAKSFTPEHAFSDDLEVWRVAGTFNPETRRET